MLILEALQFSLHSSPSEVAFHFKRLMKALEWSPMNYLGTEMYEQWQACLIDEKIRKEKRKYRRMQKKEKTLLNLQKELSTSSRRKLPESPTFNRDEVDARDIPATINQQL